MKEPVIRVLFVDDNPHDRTLVRDALEKEHDRFSLTEAATRKDFERELKSAHFDIILTDFNILGFEGLRVLEIVREKYPDLPVILVTGTGSELVAVEALKRGAADYVIKTAEHIRRLPQTILAVLDKKQLQREREEAIEAVRAGQELIKDLMDILPIGVFRNDAEGKCIYTNRKWSDISGLTAAQSQGEGWMACIHPDDKEKVLRERMHIPNEQRESTMEFRVINARNEVRNVFMHFVLRRNPDGSIDSYLGTAEDITGRKAAHAALQQSEERYRVVVETATDAIITIDDRSTILFVNPAAEKIFGYGRQEIIGQKLTMLMPESLRSAHEAGMKRYLASGNKNLNWEGVVLPGMRKDGREIPLEISFGESVWDGKRLFTGLVRDITDRISAVEALRASEEKYRALFEESQDAVFISASDGRYLDINEAGFRMFGYDSKEEFLRVNIASDLFQDPADRLTYMKQMDQEGYVKDYEKMLKRKDGTPLHVLETSRAVLDQDGNVNCYRGIMRDITHMKQLQLQVLQSQKMETIGQLAGGVAHDFNNILTAITGYCELMQMKLSPEDPVQPYLKEALASAERGASLTYQLLAFSRKQVMSPKILDLNNSIKKMDDMLQRLIGEDVRITCRLYQKLGLVRVDPSQIEQVILNLCLNARDAMPLGGDLIIETSNTELDERFVQDHLGAIPGHYILLSVSDSGCGMDEETLVHIFEPFFTTKEEGKGTGLGLATVYGIVQQSGGYIAVRSKPGQGSTFEVYLPRVDTPKQAKEKRQEPKTDRAAASGFETIVLVDDNDQVRHAIGSLLRAYGYEVLEARDGEEAIGIFKNYDPVHLLITDVIMPKFSGLELAQRIRPLHPEVKVLYMSGYADSGFHQPEMMEPDIAFLQKPVPLDTLLGKVRELLQ